jgi:hypothetical protein
MLIGEPPMGLDLGKRMGEQTSQESIPNPNRTHRERFPHFFAMINIAKRFVCIRRQRIVPTTPQTSKRGGPHPALVRLTQPPSS